MARPRRKSSVHDIRGDTGAPAVSTLHPSSPSTPAPTTPTTPLPSPRSPNTQTPRRGAKRRKARSLLRRWKTLSLTHTWVNPLIAILAVLGLYLRDPGPANPLHKAIFLSYPLGADDPLIPAHARAPGAEYSPERGTTYYGKGPDDLAFVAFYIVVLSFTREFLMQRAIRPLAVACGVEGRSKIARFMEQMYTAVYFSLFGPFGLYVMRRTPVWYFDTDGMYREFPHRAHDAPFKAYYLLEASYWAQQMIVLLLQLEKPRKDFKELVAHHFVTLALIGLSYRFHFTYMGVAVYITHDVSDFFLATSKSLSYIKSRWVTPYFIVFIASWVYLRHYINLRILWSIATSFSTVGPFELDWITQQYKCWISQYITFALLFVLQGINLFWLFLILRIAVNIVFREPLADTRSEDEDETEKEKEKEKEKTTTTTMVATANGTARPNGKAKAGSSAVEVVPSGGAGAGAGAVAPTPVRRSERHQARLTADVAAPNGTVDIPIEITSPGGSKSNGNPVAGKSL